MVDGEGERFPSTLRRRRGPAVSVTHQPPAAEVVPPVHDHGAAGGAGADGGAGAGGRARRERLTVLATAAAGIGVVVLPRLPAPVGPHAAAAVLAFVALVAESLPFLLAGAVIAAALQRVPAGRVLALAARHPRLAAAIAPFTGLVLPLCDCGLLPLARQLHVEGVRASIVNGFVAGAPLANPIVILSTLAAFPGRLDIVLGRVVVGVVVALLAGAVGPRPRTAGPVACAHGGAHDGQPAQGPGDTSSGDTHGGGHGHMGSGEGGLLTAAAAELFRMGPTLVVGALAAGAIKAFVPPEVLVAVSAQPLLGALAMMGLAFVLAICSQADAFFAASLPLGALPRLAFLLLGPAIDVRLAAMYRREFGLRWVAGYAAIVVPSVLVLATAWVTWGPS